MTDYNIYLGNPYRMKYEWQELVDAVADFFKPVVDATDRFDTVKVRSTRTAPVLARHELLCYVLPSRGSSVITRENFGSAADSLGADGTTAWQNRGAYVSEVYRGGWGVEVLSGLIYHELMHNKLREGNSMHRRGGMAAAEISEDSEQRRVNTRRMASRLHTRHTQWIGGFEMVRERQAALDCMNSDDPLACL